LGSSRSAGARRAIRLFLATATVCLHSASSDAQWLQNGKTICDATGGQEQPVAVADGVGGAIIAWEDFRSSGDIYAQRISPSGLTTWAGNGVGVCTASNEQFDVDIATDGAGGAILVWEDFRADGDIYAQRLNASGVSQWGTNGVALCDTANEQYAPHLISDGAGGAFVVWGDFRTGMGQIYAQKINSSGAPQWAAKGVLVCTAPADQFGGVITSDGAGGAIVAWYDFRNGLDDVFAQRLAAATGARLWGDSGVAVCDTVGSQSTPAIASDGSGGAVIFWDDRRGANADLYAQRVNASGAAQWTVDGVAICSHTGNQTRAVAIALGAGESIVAWQDGRNGADDIFAQRVGATGAGAWTGGGVGLCTMTGAQTVPSIVSDAASGAIVSWQDARSGTADVYARRINSTGTPQWTLDGVLMCGQANAQTLPVIVTDGASGAIVAWEDYRVSPSDIYAGRIMANGSLASPTGIPGGVALAPSVLLPNVPNPFLAETTLEFALAQGGPASLRIYDTSGRLVRTIVDGVLPAGVQRARWDGRDDGGRRVAGGVYFARLVGDRVSDSRKITLLTD
jgi:hypothetical protein